MQSVRDPDAPRADRSRRLLPPRPRPLWIAAAAVIVAVVVAGDAVIHGRSHVAPAATPPTGSEVRLEAGSPTCVDAWRGGPAGSYTFVVFNNEGDDMEVYLQDMTTGKIYLEVENFGREATRRVSALVPPGTYRWVCITSYTIKFSKPVTVTGDAPTQPVYGVTPVTPLDLRIPIVRYTAWAHSRLPILGRQVARLTADLRAGDISAAKRDWLTAHLTYETLGAAYGAFGDLDDAINGDPPDEGRPADADFAGFRKIEAMLWAGKPATSIVPHAEALHRAVGKLAAELVKPNSITPLDIGIRAHEILEDTLGGDLNGIGDAGSHTELATIDANITGTWHALQPLLPLLQKQDPYLAETRRWLRQTQKLVQSYHHENGWVPLASLTPTQRAELNAHLQQAVELLSHVAVITEPRNGTTEIGSGTTPAGGGGK